MTSLNEYMNEYKKQLQKGDIQKAYKGLMDYFGSLRSHFKNKYPDYFISGSIYIGYMDMTYFSFSPKSIKDRGLKIAIVFVHETFRFEVWLSGNNRDIQAKYRELLKDSDLNNFQLTSTPRDVDYIIDHVLIEDPDFSDLDSLTRQIEQGILAFIEDVEDILARL